MLSFIFSVFSNVVKYGLTYLIYYLKFNSLMEQVKRMAASSRQRLLLDLTFYIDLVRNIVFLSGKSQSEGILISDVCGMTVFCNLSHVPVGLACSRWRKKILS